ncbi:hypothetical protein MCOR25_010608 [Pyricularia grisea]|uniref:Uncharacterized protein n=1 Tax=Pyricularia grisea TaxID=148305 RepID=A0A6P8B1V3_PYRGI|nr:uncharacterized protein PgNI_07666 [Pyricularia grisea]KAI6350072.1 hypothetical protein MCOR25_010608 [Pyricularia grisea]TLD08784.1 hypothetical protein PgNI_07666 [Pyricularia grisea]
MSDQVDTEQWATPENAPLLGSSSTLADEHATDFQNAAPGDTDVEAYAQLAPRPEGRPKDIFIGTWLSLVLSVVGLAGFIAAFVFLGKLGTLESPNLGWWTQYSAPWFMAMNKPMWLGPNLFIDMTIPLILVTHTTGYPAGDRAYYTPNYPRRPPSNTYEPACLENAVILKILLGVAFGSTFLLAFVHVFLAIKRWIDVFRARRREGNGVTRFGIPSGQLSSEFTIKFLDQDGLRARGDASRTQA